MKMYYDHMHSYHISYAANPGTKKAYIRGRRYMPERQGLKGTALKPDYSTPELFAAAGRIGLRHMFTRSARYANFQVSRPNR